MGIWNRMLLLVLLSITFFKLNAQEVEKYSSEENPPNIVVFMVDDLGWQDTSVPFWNKKTPFNQLYKTPNMERLAKEGMKFTQAYATPVCSPTRVSFMTGMNAARHRVTNWTLEKNKATDYEDEDLSFPAWNVNGISPEEGVGRTVLATTLPQILKDNGYQTIHVGKAHFGAIDTPGENPLNLGFTINIAGHAAGSPHSYLGTEDFGNNGDKKHLNDVPGLEKYYGKDIFLTEALTREALIALDSVKSKPFFLYMAHYAVHIPLYGDNRYLQKYIDKGLDEEEAKYASMVEGMDKSLGDIMNYLDENDLAENTIILFMSDNGGLSAHKRGGELHTHNKPLASGKGSMYEGGIREPMLVKWPRVIKPESVTNEYLIIEDFFPTILEMAGIEKVETIQQVDGKSFVPLIKKNKTSNNRSLFWHYPNRWGGNGPGIGTSSMIRKGDWKLIYFYKDQHFELYNIPNDIGEENNLSHKERKVVSELASELTNYLKQVKAQLPIDKKTKKTVKYPAETL
ncbi:arylsulfatase A family protein [Galbibacter orientalis DSM 19592]|uniref:Arylsulfatase A family protein n=1 Tax=Galbibacter orientalis DSM 19592 TaxID=926559 RepID=I3C7J1_9FLAO|nr:sulfatase [Galbibacter orientalis]EIJ39584.1 arylsulfatase A family protein [Galbibacter orientalis DSM 19592]